MIPTGRGRRWPALTAAATALAMAAVLAAPSSPGRTAPPWLAEVLDSAVLVTGTAQVWSSPGHPPEVFDWHGTGWTAACRPEGDGYRIAVRTAGHVLDLADVLAETLRQGPGPFRVEARFEVRYRDGARHLAGLDGAAFGEGDSAALEFASPVPRPCLPSGDPAAVEPGDRLHIVAHPGPLRFAVGEGVLSARAADRWLSTVPVAPGASGAPVLDEEGAVVAHAVGMLRWPWGTLAVLQPVGEEP